MFKNDRNKRKKKQKKKKKNLALLFGWISDEINDGRERKLLCEEGKMTKEKRKLKNVT